MIIRILTVACMLSLVSCLASTPISSSRQGTSQEKSASLNTTPSSDGLAVVYILREAKSYGQNVVYLIGVDQQPVIALANNSYTRIEMPPGVYKFKYVVQADDFNKTTSDFDSGHASLLIRPDTVNIVPFIPNVASSFGNMRYGKAALDSFTRVASYQVPLQHAVTTAQMLAPVPASSARTKQPASVISKPATKTSSQFALLQKQASCKLKNNSWAYTGKQCKNGFAHGTGSSEETTGLKFIGKFDNGQRTKGEIHQAGTMIFSGDLVDDKPHGNAICYYEDEYEECRFYKGKRIDTLYKMRKENAKMKADMERMQQPRPVTVSNTSGNGITDYAVDAVQREAVDRTTDFIFDSLF